MKPLLLRRAIRNLSRLNQKAVFTYPYSYRSVHASSVTLSSSILSPSTHDFTFRNHIYPIPFWDFNRKFSSVAEETRLGKMDGEGDDSEDGAMNEFLSRFVWIMRGKVSETYPDCDKHTIDGMLLIIVQKVVSEMEKGGLGHMLASAAATPSQDLSEDLWKTVWEVSNLVLEDMHKAKKKEKMKGFLQSEEVKEMCRFAGEVGVRGDMLRELRFKWAREKMEESEFYENLERLKEEAQAEEENDEEVGERAQAVYEDGVVAEETPQVVSLPKRHGKIQYKIYGLDLSDPKWAEVADRIHEAEEGIWPQEPKPISGKCKIVTDRVLSLKGEDEISPLLTEWVELLKPNRIDWITLLDRLKEQNADLYYKVAELVLSEKSFQANIRDYSKLIDAHAKENRVEDAERILKKMNENGILPDILTSTILVHMYSKTGNLVRAKEEFENLRSQGFQPDMKVYNSMIMAYVNAGEPKLGESLMREMEARDVKPSKEIYMALLRSFAQRGDDSGAHRIATTMLFAGFQPSLESCTLLVEAYGQAGDSDQARSNFDYMIKLGHKPDDRCTASMIAAYEKKNLLDKALNLLLQLEKDGFERGTATYTVLVDWLCRLQLLDEAEQLVSKIVEQGEAPPLKVHVSLCVLYSTVGLEKKALQTLGILEANKEQLCPKEFEQVISGLINGGFVQDALRMHSVMVAQGFKESAELKVALWTSQAINPNRQIIR